MPADRDLPRASQLDYLAHLASDSARFASALDLAAPGTPVPTCPDWNADDLLWHLGQVQWFWGTIVREGVDQAGAEQLMPPRPDSRPGLEIFYRQASRDLASVLASTSPDAPAWTWAQDKTVGFIRRRQAHEALIHRLDAELTSGSRTDLDPALSTDGVDEVIRVMFGGDPPAWGTFTAEPGRTLRIRASDTGDSWFVELGQFRGTDPADQKSYDEPGIRAASADPGTTTAATVSGTAADLDCWLWHRPPLAGIERSGDAEVLRGFEAVISDGIN
jgi:uncharacterized protein (TIGR03083 family)